jgi:hypothetical protein
MSRGNLHCRAQCVVSQSSTIPYVSLQKQMVSSHLGGKLRLLSL